MRYGTISIAPVCQRAFVCAFVSAFVCSRVSCHGLLFGATVWHTWGCFFPQCKFKMNQTTRRCASADTRCSHKAHRPRQASHKATHARCPISSAAPLPGPAVITLSGDRHTTA